MNIPALARMSPETLNIHHYMDEGEAVVSFKRDGHEWIVVEMSCYEPDPDHSDDPAKPWITTGEQSYFNMSLWRGFKRDVFYAGDMVQGLVYAIDALRYGSTHEPQFYIDFIRDELVPADFADKCRPLNFFELMGVRAAVAQRQTPHVPVGGVQ